jgi:hypothetical protein
MLARPQLALPRKCMVDFCRAARLWIGIATWAESQCAYGRRSACRRYLASLQTSAQQRAAIDADKERTLELSEKDVISVLELVLNEDPIERNAMFLMGHSMGSGDA